MPRNARVVTPGLPYHITQRGTNRERVFFTTGDKVLYLQLIRENMEQAGVQVLAYCLMTNHVHFVVVPEREDSLPVLFGRANGRYCHKCPQRPFLMFTACVSEEQERELRKCTYSGRPYG